MTKDKIKKAIWQTVDKGKKVCVYSTVDAKGNPHSRYMGAMMIRKGIFYMATASDARKMRQIKNNPRSELLFAAGKYKEIATISGKSTLEKSLALKKAFWKAHPVCKNYFSNYDAPGFGLIAFRPNSGEYLNLAVQHGSLAVSLP